MAGQESPRIVLKVVVRWRCGWREGHSGEFLRRFFRDSSEILGRECWEGRREGREGIRVGRGEGKGGERGEKIRTGL